MKMNTNSGLQNCYFFICWDIFGDNKSLVLEVEMAIRVKAATRGIDFRCKVLEIQAALRQNFRRLGSEQRSRSGHVKQLGNK